MRTRGPPLLDDYVAQLDRMRMPTVLTKPQDMPAVRDIERGAKDAATVDWAKVSKPESIKEGMYYLFADWLRQQDLRWRASSGDAKMVILFPVYTSSAALPTGVYSVRRVQPSEPLSPAVTMDDLLETFLGDVSGGVVANSKVSGLKAGIINRVLSINREIVIQRHNPNRNLMAFDNGIFNLATVQFYTWGTPGAGTAPGEDVAVYIPHMFDPLTEAELSDWTTIPDAKIGLLRRIFDAQKFTPEVVDVLLIMMGRMLYGINEYDSWQLMLMLFGVGGCGKSTLILLLRMFFDNDAVGSFPANASETFGITEAFLWPGVRVMLEEECGSDKGKRPPAFAAATIKKVIRGEELVGPVKYGAQPTRGVFPGHVAIAGQLPPYHESDESGALPRSTVGLRFTQKIPADQQQQNLLKLIAPHLSTVLQVIVHKYRTAAAQSNGGGLKLPSYFEETRKALIELQRPESAFLDENRDVIKFTGNPDDQCLRSSVIALYNEFCDGMGIKSAGNKLALFSSEPWQRRTTNGTHAIIPYRQGLTMDGKPVSRGDAVIQGVQLLETVQLLPPVGAVERL
jgi:hypothetical protein